MRSVSGSGCGDARAEISDFSDQPIGNGVTWPNSTVAKATLTLSTRPLVNRFQSCALLPSRMPPGLALKRTSRLLLPIGSGQRPFHPITHCATSARPSAPARSPKNVTRCWRFSSTPAMRSPKAGGSKSDRAVRTVADTSLVSVLIRNGSIGRSLVAM